MHCVFSPNRLSYIFTQPLTVPRHNTPASASSDWPTFLSHQGVLISPNTVQRILREHAPVVPSVAGLRRRWHAFEALAPHVLWAMDICYLYTSKRDGFDRYLITILDDHSRTVIASGLYARQTVAEVVEVLKAAASSNMASHSDSCATTAASLPAVISARLCGDPLGRGLMPRPITPSTRGRSNVFSAPHVARCPAPKRLRWPQDCTPYG